MNATDAGQFKSSRRPRQGTDKKLQKGDARRDARRELARRQALRPKPRSAPPQQQAPVVQPKAPVSAEMSAEIAALQKNLNQLVEASQLSGAYQAIGAIEDRLTQIPLTLAALRKRGYIHSGLLEDRLIALDQQWDGLREQVESQLKSQSRALQRQLAKIELQVRRLNTKPDQVTLIATQGAVERLESKIDATANNLSSLSDGIESELRSIDRELQKVDWMLDRLDETSEIDLSAIEAPLTAVKAIWQQQEDEGPEGILFLTDQHLFFEQREEIVT